MDGANQPETRRERRIRRRREEILAAATRVFSRKGYAAATTKDIASEADMGESTLYNYFPGKHDILLATLRSTGKDFDEAFEQVRGLENREALIGLLEAGIVLFTQRIDFTRTLLAQAWLDNQVLEEFISIRLQAVAGMIQAFIAERIQAGTFRPFDPELGARAALGMFVGLMLPVLRGLEAPPDAEKRHRMAEAVVEILLNGISGGQPPRSQEPGC